jgi:hypothetical protein
LNIPKDNGKNIRDNLSMRLALERLFNGTFVYIIVTYCFYRDNDIVRIFVRRAAVLPLVPPELVEDVWFNVLEDSEEIILGHFTHLENNTCVVIHHALKRLSDRMDNLKGRD